MRDLDLGMRTAKLRLLLVGFGDRRVSRPVVPLSILTGPAATRKEKGLVKMDHGCEAKARTRKVNRLSGRSKIMPVMYSYSL